MRLQAALEYLTTYGWAILILAVVLVVLASQGFFSPQKYAPQQCIFSSGFSCIYDFLSTNGLLQINIGQSAASAINVTSIGCNENGTETEMQAPYNPPSNQVFMPVGANYTFTVQCYAGATAASGNVGDVYSGSVLLNYTDEVSGLPSVAVGRLSVKFT